MAANDQADSQANSRRASHAPQGFRLPPAALHTRHQLLFDRNIKRPLETENSRPYEKIAVLLISWIDSDLKGVDEEVGYQYITIVAFAKFGTRLTNWRMSSNTNIISLLDSVRSKTPVIRKRN
jgi:hypothetical protein